MENGIIIDGDAYEYVDGVSDKGDSDQLHNVCGSCALYEKCEEMYGDNARNYPCDIFGKGWMWHFKRVEKK